MEALIWDIYPRDLKVEGEGASNEVSTEYRQVTVDSFFNTFEGGDELTLCRVPVQVTVHEPISSLTTIPRSLALVVAQPKPEPLQVHNAPPAAFDPDGSFEFLPEVTGGLGPYEFSIDTLDEGFDFNNSTGQFSRSPQ